jgi:hypothetical protein
MDKQNFQFVYYHLLLENKADTVVKCLMQLYPSKLQVSLTSNVSITNSNNNNNNENKNGSDTDIGNLDHASSSESVSTSRNTSGNSMLLQLFENLSSKDSYISSHRYSVSECCGGLTINQVYVYCNILLVFEYNILRLFYL